MKDCGIAVSQVHERNDKHTCVKEFRSNLPALDKTIGKMVSIPVGWWVTEEERKSGCSQDIAKVSIPYQDNIYTLLDSPGLEN